MSIDFARRAMTVAAVLALTGCSSTPAATSPPQAPQNAIAQMRLIARESMRVEYSTQHPLLYEANNDQNVVHIYQIAKLGANPAPIATISGLDGPSALASNNAGTLYVANSGATSEILLFRKGSTHSFRSISTGVSEPFGIALDQSGTLFVSNGRSRTVTEYPKNHTSPSQTIGGFQCPEGLAVDVNGNVFVADVCQGQVFEITKGSAIATSLNLQDLTAPFGCAVDKGGNLWVSDVSNSEPKVNVYAPGSNSPIHTMFVFISPDQISVDERGQVFVSDSHAAKIFGFRPGHYTPYVVLTTNISVPTGVLARP